MKNPFAIGRLARGSDFLNREEEMGHLVKNFQTGDNSILISPGKWGNSSLIKKATEQFDDQEKIKFCFINLKTIRSEDQFYLKFLKEVLLVTSTNQDDVRNNVQNYLSRYFPRITFKKDSEIKFALKLDLEEAIHFPEEILSLAESIVSKKDYLLNICIDNFQNILEFNNHLDFLKKLNLYWARHLSTSYCLSGRKAELLKDIFLNSKMPLFKFGEVIQLQKIKSPLWKSLIKQKFDSTGKSIKNKSVKLILKLTDCHPFYVQHLCRLSWMSSTNKCKNSIVREAFVTMVDQLDLIFQNYTGTLSTTQINFLSAFTDNIDQLSSKETIQNYKLGTSANVNRIKQALIKKEIINISDGQIELQDPIYKYWLRYRYFK